ncbi:uncharacterized protein LOC129218387 [Uloborus diversus]|uniref:uncharacterized protein LOC129218387 n=1 Tax=Uloborus diversus TaxID=327109 RepID=UPI00240A062A|nr:uncharacterized protein LOC129218387 [Uloborus diversus]
MQLLKPLSNSQNMTFQAPHCTSSQEGKLTFAKGLDSQADIFSPLITETGVNKKPKPPVPPKPRLKLKEHATDASKTHSDCGNGKENPALFQKCLDEMFHKQVEVSRSQMHKDVKLFQNEKDKSNEFPKDIATECVRKVKHNFQSKRNAIESGVLQNSLKQDIATSEAITNEENVTTSVSTETPTIIHPLMPEYETTLQDVDANSSNVSHFFSFSSKSVSISRNEEMNDVPRRRKVVSFSESIENILDAPSWVPPRPPLPQRTHRSLSCSSLVKSFQEFSLGKKTKITAKTSTDLNQGSTEEDYHLVHTIGFHSPARFVRPTTREPAWFHNVEPFEANRRLFAMGQDGAFLVRPTSGMQYKEPSRLTLCVAVADYILNLRIRQQEDGTYAFGSYKSAKKTFRTVKELLHYHQSVPIEAFLTEKRERMFVRLLVTPPKELF